MDTSTSAKKRLMSAASTDTDSEACYQRPNSIKRPKVKDNEEPHAGEREVPIEEAMYPLPPFRQTPGPISVSQSYIRRLIIERWDAEIRYCEKAKKLRQFKMRLGQGRLTIIQASLQRLVAERWDAEAKRCEEAKRAQLLELLLAAHGITRLV
ncbi:hypothetical protein DFH29DRAFT_1004361 [Suillus ampliporus]|nr:hypothetical protein DFH29DRAFT_1004361 [Suillus ampliporus]